MYMHECIAPLLSIYYKTALVHKRTLASPIINPKTLIICKIASFFLQSFSSFLAPTLPPPLSLYLMKV